MVRLISELYRYRALIKALVIRHLSIRYRGSLLGFLWSFLNPLCLMLVYAVVFRYYIRFSEVQNYTVFLFCGLLPWIWFSSGLSEGTSSIVSGGHLITKSMFPAQILPTVAVLTQLVHFVLALPLLFIFMAIAGMEFHATIALLPLLLLVQLVFTSGLALALGSLNVQFRDVQHIIANILSFVFFLTPIIYPASTVPDRFQFTLALNPLAILTTFYHGLILDGVLPSLDLMLMLLCFTGISVIVGHLVFERNRESFAELL